MTATLSRPAPPFSAFESDVLYEEPVPCTLSFKDSESGKVTACPNIAKYDCFVTCAVGHDRTQHYCERCHKGALEGLVDCKVCRVDENKQPTECPITVVASYERTTS